MLSVLVLYSFYNARPQEAGSHMQCMQATLRYECKHALKVASSSGLCLHTSSHTVYFCAYPMLFC